MTSNPFLVFVIDDDREMRQSLVHLLQQSGFRVRPYSDATLALRELDHGPDVVLSDVRMPRMTGLELLGELGELDHAPPLVLISAHGDIPTAVKAMQDGAYSFLEKPYDPRRLISILTHAAENQRLLAATQRMARDLTALSGLDRVLVGDAPAITGLRQEILDIAAADGSVLISGETGTGKEVVARALHNLGPARDHPFVAVNCATIAPERFDAMIFGAVDGGRGLIRSAQSGTLFLDEVSACPDDVQAKLLRVIETGEVLPIGADQVETVDVRVIAASNENLEDLVAAGRFRSDLFYRLSAFILALPRLADRGEDVLLLYEHFLRQMAETYEISPPAMTADDTAALMAHGWPGNVRELRHIAERRALAHRRGVGSVAEALRPSESADAVPATLREAVATFERSLIGNAIRANQGRMDAVAEALGIGRRTLNEKIAKLGLDKSEFLD
ncbi:MAG: response regulator [Boseongicola sp.]|nr:MAG: response regulator [Boseongicola sp.]